MRIGARLLSVTAMVLVSGCFQWPWDPHPGEADAQVPDASRADGGAPDGGTLDGGPHDGGMSDAGPSDGGPLDGGMQDSGPLDGGAPDASLIDGGEGHSIVRAFDEVSERLVPADYSCRGTEEPMDSRDRVFELVVVPFATELPLLDALEVRRHGPPTGACTPPDCATVVITSGMATATLFPGAFFSYRTPGTAFGSEPVDAATTIGYLRAPADALRPISLPVTSTGELTALLRTAGAGEGTPGGALVGVATDCLGRPVWGASLRLVDADGFEIRADGRGMQPFYFDAPGETPEGGRAMTSESGRFGAYAVPPDGAGRELCVELWGVLEAGGSSELLGASPAAFVDGGLTLRDVPPLPATHCSGS